MNLGLFSFKVCTGSYCLVWSFCSRRRLKWSADRTIKKICCFSQYDSNFTSLYNICSLRLVSAQARTEDADASWFNEQSLAGVNHKIGDIVAGKYKIIGFLGQGGLGTTYEAETQDGGTVALKAMSLRNMKGWKDLELFEREARTLKALKHSGIPKYIDYFEVDSEIDRAFYIVQKVAKGRSLEQLIQYGWRANEKEVKRIAIEVLEVLQYLESLMPPVIHRDIKPENIILDEDSGKVKVVDFGAVQDVASITLTASTIVGTYGYMAPEQFQNKATLQTDLYGLGATLLYLISGRSPSSFPQRRLRVDFQGQVSISSKLALIIERLLEPAPEDRFQSAAEVIAAFKREERYWIGMDIFEDIKNSAAEQPSFVGRPRRPVGTKVLLCRTPSKLSIKVPPIGLTTETIGTGTFALAWNSFLLFWTRSAMFGGAPLFFTLFSFPFWFVGFRLAKNTASALAVTVDLEFQNSDFCIQWSIGSFFKQQTEGRTQDISAISIVIDGENNGQVITSCQIIEGAKTHKFGSGLGVVELDWILHEMSAFLGLGPPRLGKASRSIEQ